VTGQQNNEPGLGMSCMWGRSKAALQGDGSLREPPPITSFLEGVAVQPLNRNPKGTPDLAVDGLGFRVVMSRKHCLYSSLDLAIFVNKSLCNKGGIIFAVVVTFPYLMRV